MKILVALFILFLQVSVFAKPASTENRLLKATKCKNLAVTAEEDPIFKDGDLFTAKCRIILKRPGLDCQINGEKIEFSRVSYNDRSLVMKTSTGQITLVVDIKTMIFTWTQTNTLELPDKRNMVLTKSCIGTDSDA